MGQPFKSKTEVTFVPGSAKGIKCEIISPREALPREDPGVDWSAERIVIARTKNGKQQLWWMKSGRYWAGIVSGVISSPAELRIIKYDCNELYPHHQLTLQEGGRLSKKLLRSKAKEINEFFDCPIAQFLEINNTTVILKK